MRIIGFLTAVHDALTRWGAYCSALCLASIVSLYGIEVVVRYWLNAPTAWSAAIAVYMLLATVMLMMPYITSHAQHVSASIIETFMPPKVAWLVALMIAAAATIICATSAYISFSELLRSYRAGTLTTDTLYIPRWWLLSLLVYGLASSTLHFARQFGRLVGGRSRSEALQ